MSHEAGFSTSKRSACDRCRSQKLRCPPRESSTEACSRCSRLGARCMTSYSRLTTRLGRGNATSGALHPSRPVLKPKGTVPSPTHTSPQSQDLAPPSLPNSTLSSLTNYNSISATAAVGAASRPTSYPDLNQALEFTRPEHDLDSFASKHMGTVFTSSVSYQDRTEPVVTDVLYLGFNNVPILQSQSSSTCDTANTTSVPVQKQKQWNQEASRRASPTKVLECDERLSTLSANLSRHHQQCLALLEDGSKERSSVDSTEIQGCKESRSSKLFGDALSDTAEFLAIVESYGSGEVGGASITGATCAGNSATSSTRVGLIIILSLISTYLQIVALYEKLFYDLCQQLLNPPAGSGLQILPGLRLASFSVQQGNMQTKILVQAILYQFDKIERCLGLPVEFRVTEKHEAYHTGVFGDERARILLEAVSNSKWSYVAVDDHSGLKALPSLQDRIRRAQAYLDT
jgi:hypothetical protein